jgi:hypothetical protein
MISKLSWAGVLALIVLSPARSFAQQGDALSIVLNKHYLTPIPDSLSRYKPGALVVLKPKGIPDPQDPESDVADMVVVPDTGMIPAVTLSSENDFSVAATLFGFSPTAKFGKLSTLKTDPIILSGWRLTTDETRTIAAKGSKTYQAAQLLYQRSRISFPHLTTSGRNWALYLIDSIYTTTSTNVSVSSDTVLAFSGDTLPSCAQVKAVGDSKTPPTTPTKDSAQKPANFGASSPSADTTPHNASTQDTPNSQGNSPNTAANPHDSSTGSADKTPPDKSNPVAADITALGSAATSVAGVVEGAPKTSAPPKTDMAIKNLLPVKLPSITFCRNSSSSVSFTSDSPVPVAMILKRVVFLQNGTMTLNAETATW